MGPVIGRRFGIILDEFGVTYCCARAARPGNGQRRTRGSSPNGASQASSLTALLRSRLYLKWVPDAREGRN